jgi:hypothetical protein
VDLGRLLRALGWDRERRARRFVAYFQLRDACGHSGCPVCRCLRELTRRSLAAVLYEQVTDPATRAVLRDSWGLCAWHASMATEVEHAALGMAIIYQDLLGRLRSHLVEAQRQAGASRAGRGWRLFRRTVPPALVSARAARRPCPLCVDVAHSEASYLHVVLDGLRDDEFDAAYAGSAGLCLPHLSLALAAFPGHPGTPGLLGHAVRKLDRLTEALGRFVDKHDHRQPAPFTDQEAAAWTAAVELFAGRPDLFPNEVARLPRGPVAPRAPGAPPGSAGAAGPRVDRLEALAADNQDLERRLRDLDRRLGDETSRAAGLRYRLGVVEEDRKVLELNLAGERAAARTWEAVARGLQREIDELRARPAARDASSGAA